MLLIDQEWNPQNSLGRKRKIDKIIMLILIILLIKPVVPPVLVLQFPLQKQVG